MDLEGSLELPAKTKPIQRHRNRDLVRTSSKRKGRPASVYMTMRSKAGRKRTETQQSQNKRGVDVQKTGIVKSLDGRGERVPKRRKKKTPLGARLGGFGTNKCEVNWGSKGKLITKKKEVGGPTRQTLGDNMEKKTKTRRAA